jgi:ABC-type amino acid transport system permease subunit
MEATPEPKRGEMSAVNPLSTAELEQVRDAPVRFRDSTLNFVYRFPWWALLVVLVGVWVGFSIAANEIYSSTYDRLKEGIDLTLRVTFFAYGLALVLGLVLGIIRSNPPKPQRGFVRGTISMVQLVIYNIATIIVEVMRGLPILIVLLIGAFVIIPEVKTIVNESFLNEKYGIELTFRGSSVTTAIIALGFAYGAYLSEIFRAGIQSIEKGQIEAARSLGMTYSQTMRLVVLPQAIRRVLPPLGNDFVAMIKDSSLVAILGIRDVTQLAKITSGSNFRYVETYSIVAVLYLTMTILGSLLVKGLERYLSQEER